MEHPLDWSSQSPFRMPVRVVRAHCRLARPVLMGDREAMELPQRLRGAWLESLGVTGCRGNCNHNPANQTRTLVCARPQECAVPRLFKPRCQWQKRDHPPSVALWPEPTGADSFVLEAVCLGRHASSHRQLIDAALEDCGRRGVMFDDRPAPFLLDHSVCFDGSIDRLVAAEARPASELLLGFMTPCEVRSEDLGDVAGNAAHDLVQWDLADSGASSILLKAGCDELAELARVQARRALAALAVQTLNREDVYVGRRWSESFRGSFRLSGFTAFVRLTGAVAEALPWLILLSIRGAGRHKSFGSGHVRLWRRNADNSVEPVPVWRTNGESSRTAK